MVDYKNEGTYLIYLWCSAGDSGPYQAPKSVYAENGEKADKSLKYWIRPASLTTDAKQDEISELFDKFNSVPFDDRVNRKAKYVDSIQILNYPGLAKWINLKRFAAGKVKGRKYRNRRIGELFKEIDLSEKKGTGIPKILRELKQNGSPEPEFDMDEERTYLNAIIRIRDGFERKEKISESMSESMSELERARMQIILIYLETNKEINSSVAAKLLEVEIKTASRLLLKAEKLDILKSAGKTKNKVYFRE